MNDGLPLLVSLTGLVVASVGLLGMLSPDGLRSVLRRHRALVRLPVTLTLRIVTGSVFLFAAPMCRAPTVIRTIGLLEFGGAATLLVLGSERLDRFADWWLQRPSSFVRYWCLGALALGLVLVLAGA